MLLRIMEGTLIEKRSFERKIYKVQMQHKLQSDINYIYWPVAWLMVLMQEDISSY